MLCSWYVCSSSCAGELSWIIITFDLSYFVVSHSNMCSHRPWSMIADWEIWEMQTELITFSTCRKPSKLNLFKYRIVHPVRIWIYSCLSYNCNGEFSSAIQSTAVEHLISIFSNLRRHAMVSWSVQRAWSLFFDKNKPIYKRFTSHNPIKIDAFEVTKRS